MVLNYTNVLFYKFSIIKKSKWKLSHFLPHQKKIWNPLELDENMQFNDSSLVCPENPYTIDLPSILTVNVHLTGLCCKN